MKSKKSPPWKISLKTDTLFSILIFAVFKLYDQIYYLRFSVKPEVFEEVQEDINLIINSFYILNY